VALRTAQCDTQEQAVMEPTASSDLSSTYKTRSSFFDLVLFEDPWIKTQANKFESYPQDD